MMRLGKSSERCKTVVLTRSQHSVSRADIDRSALDVLYRLNNNGYVACLVGGAVRDLLLKRKPKDFDVGTTAHPNQVRRLFRNSFLVGRRFRLAHIRFGNQVIETSTFRRKPEPVDATADEEESLYLHHDNAYGTPEEDAARRDFTINGLFYDIDGFKIVDHVGGLRDLKRKIVRIIGDPDTRFSEDPVRMLRAIRFAARLGFTIEKRTWSSMLRNHAEILKSSPARLYEELLKQFAYGAGAESIRLMNKSGLLADLMPGLSSYLASANKGGAFFWRCLEVLDQRNKEESDPSAALIFGVLCNPLYLEKEASTPEEARRNPRVMAQDVVHGIAPDLAMPRKIYFQVVYMLNNQRLFATWDEGSAGRQRHLVRQDSFINSDILYDLMLAANRQAVPKHKPWVELYHECGQDAENGDESVLPQRRRRRGGRRRRRG